MKKFILILLVVLTSNSVFAAPAVKGQVKAMYINSGGTVLFRVSTPPAACNDNTWPFTFHIDHKVAKEWVSMLLAARTAKQEILIGYNSSNTGRCTIAYIYHND